MADRTYLGDGVYIATTGMGFALSTSDSVDTTNEIILNERTYAAQREYCDRILGHLDGESSHEHITHE